MNRYAVITENDESVWDDDTGIRYHFPSKYLRLLTPGTLIIYYKGKLKNSAFRNARLSAEPHYFGTGVIGAITPDNDERKKSWYADIEAFEYFPQPILAKQNNRFLEPIPDNKKNNYWRDGVREISEDVYWSIRGRGSVDSAHMDHEYTSIVLGREGKKVMVYTTKYERDLRLKEEAVRFHGAVCQACDFDFERVYGAWGRGFIHVHHKKPISTTGETIVDPRTDLVPVCPNCHAMIHRKKGRLLSVEEVKNMLGVRPPFRP